MGVKLLASSGGSVELVPTNTASNFTVTVPASTTTMVGTDATQTLSNKTLTSPALTTPIASTTIGVGGATPAASGAGITFPATQSASTDANTLDDYEEGTFTSTIVADASNPTVTYTQQRGVYVKVGRLVWVSYYVAWSAISGGSGYVQIGGLPFSQSSLGGLNTDEGGAVMETLGVTYPASRTYLVNYAVSGNARAWLLGNGSGVSGVLLALGNLSSSGYILGSFWYSAA